MIKILVADDHAVVRRGLKQILSEEADMRVSGEACDASEAVRKALEGHWDIMVLDITLPGRSGLDVLKELKKRQPDLPVLILSMHPEDQFAFRVLEMGAAGYLSKDSMPDELVKAIRKVIRGGKYVSSSLAEKFARDLELGPEKKPHERLSCREYEVMVMIARGKKIKQIANELYLSVKTVSTYRARILEKMKMETNAELIHYVINNNLITRTPLQ